MSNPWLTDQTVDPAKAAATPMVPATGPTVPQRSVTAPDLADQLPIHDQAVTAQLWVVGVHGGAGESTLAAMAEDWRAAGHAWPRTGTTARVLLVARSSVRGLTAAQTAARQWASGAIPFVDLVGLAVLADAPGRLPKPLRDLASVVAGGVPRTWTLPWVQAWRLGEPVDSVSLPRQARRLLDDVIQLTQSVTPSGAHHAST